MTTRSGLGVVCDFDGTITVADVAVAILRAFDPPGWRRCVDEFNQGLRTDHETMTGSFSTLALPMAAITAWAVEHAQLRDGFPAFLAWCAEHKVPTVIASNGLDLYIEPILIAHGLVAPEILCARAAPGAGGLAVTYDHLWGAGFRDERDQKRLAVRRMQAQGLRVVFIGDGAPDFRAAQIADIVFARERLREQCDAAGVHCTPFESFSEVTAHLELRAAAEVAKSVDRGGAAGKACASGVA